MDADKQRLLLIKIGRQLKKEDVSALKYLFREELGAGELEDKDRYELMSLLEENGKLDDIEEFCKILDSIGREDISALVLGRPKKNGAGEIVKDEKPPVKTKSESKLPVELLGEVANKIGSDWRRFARRLGFEEHSIEQIDCDYRKTYEKAYQVLSKWRQADVNRTWVDLKATLNKMPRKDIIRSVEINFSNVIIENSQDVDDENPNLQQESADESSIRKNISGLVLTNNATTSAVPADQEVSTKEVS